MHTRHLLIILWWTKTVGRPKKGGKDMRTPKSKPKNHRTLQRANTLVTCTII